MRTPVIVVYDVCDDDRRDRLRRALRPVADRFQQSGWYLPADVGLTAGRVVTALDGLLGPGDRLGAYQPCPRCARAAQWLPGGGWRPPGGQSWLAVATR
jgi:CRISPR/Cas system-associated endoribonuclease Cas2